MESEQPDPGLPPKAPTDVVFKRGELLADGSTFVVIDRSGADTPRDAIASPMSDKGSSSHVYRVRDQVTGMDRAVKILNPEPKLRDAVKWEDLCTVIYREARTLSALTHSHLAKLITFGGVDLTPPGGGIPGGAPGRTRPFLVMEFIEGVPLHEYLEGQLAQGPEPAEEIVVTLLTDVLSALSYMHNRMAAHCDVKEANILIRKSDRHEAILVDVGVAHINLDSDEADRTVFSSTEGRHDDVWEERVGKLVPREEIIKDRVAIDLHMFGVMLLMLLNIRVPTGKKRYAWQSGTAKALESGIGEHSVTVLRTVGERCVSRHYASADDVRRDLQSIRSGYVSPFGVPELSMGSEAKTSIALPDSRIIVTNRVARVVNHPTVQRLGEIRQLDLVKHIYPGATHTRLLHALETYNVTRAYVGALLGDPVFRAYADKGSLEGVLLAALLHDIGHYPLEHVFEDLAHRRDSVASGSPFAGVLTDDDVAAAMLQTEKANDDAVGKYVAGLEQQNAAMVAEMLRDKSLVPLRETVAREFGDNACERMLAIIGGKDPDVGTSILRSIISSPIDADKVAYLRSDSYMSGVSFGRGLDVDSLLASLTCMTKVPHPMTRASIGVRAKGIAAAEGVAEARRWLYQRVYWHHTNRALMAMMRYPIQSLLLGGGMTFEQYFRETFVMTDVEAIKWVDGLFARSGKTTGPNPAGNVVEGRRGIYKRLLQLPERGPEEWVKARNYLMQRPCVEWLQVGADVARVVRGYVPETKDSDVLLDIPVKDRYRVGDVPVSMEDGTITALSLVSSAFASTQEFFRQAAMVCRVYVHPAVMSRIAEMKPRNAVREAVVKVLAK